MIKLFFSLFGPFLISLTGSIISRALLSLGIGLTSYLVLNTLASNLVLSSTASLSSSGTFTIAMIQLSGFSGAVTIISSAVITRVSMLAVSKYTAGHIFGNSIL